MLGGVQRRHLDRGHRPQPLRDGVAHDAVHVPVAHQRPRMAVVGAKDEVARVEAAFRHRLHLRRHVVPGRPQPQHRPHPLPDPRHRVVGRRPLVVVRRPARRIGVERPAKVGRGVVPAHRQPGGCGRGDPRDHLRIVSDHAGEVHHLAQPDHAGPGQRLGDVGGGQLRPRVFQPRRARHAAGHLHIDVDGQAPRLVVHQPDAGQAQDVRDLVRVDEHRGGAVRDHGADELGHGDEAAFDMHVRVDETRDKVAAGGVDDLGPRAYGVGRVGADIGEASLGHDDVGAWDDLARIDVDPGAAADHQIGRTSAHRHVHKGRGRPGPCFLHHPPPPSPPWPLRQGLKPAGFSPSRPARNHGPPPAAPAGCWPAPAPRPRTAASQGSGPGTPSPAAPP